MRPGPDDKGDKSFIPKSETDPAGPDEVARGTRPGARPFTGGYYWFPTPGPDEITWSIVTNRDLGCGRHAGHDADLWPRLMVPLAETWSKDVQLLKRNLALFYTGLPRGRVTLPEKTFLILHGNDSPAAGWEKMVIESFRLSGRKVKFIFDEHETQLPGHIRTLEAMLGTDRSNPKGDSCQNLSN